MKNLSALAKFALLRKQRGIFGIGDLFGGEEESSGTKSGTETSDKRSQATTTTEGETRTQLLEDPIRQAANSVVLALAKSSAEAAGAKDADLSRLASALEARALGAEDALRDSNAAVLAKARRTGERSLAQLNRGLSEQAGGVSAQGNSIVAAATADAMVDLETNLAALEGEMSVNARNVGTQEMMAAVSGFQQALAGGATATNAMAQLLGVLRGANAVTTTDETKVLDATENIVRQLDEVFESEGSTGESFLSGLGGFISDVK